jgi:hypothetical protein
LVGVVNLLFTIVALLAIDKAGRRPLLLTATAGMGLCLVVFGYAGICAISFLYIYYRLAETKNRTLEEIESTWGK